VGRKVADCEVKPEAIWSIANTFSKMGGPKAPYAIHGPLGPIFYPTNKANKMEDCLENLFRAHDLCDYDHRPHVEAQVEALLVTVSEDIPVNF
jgi:hypothetical protein